MVSNGYSLRCWPQCLKYFGRMKNCGIHQILLKEEACRLVGLDKVSCDTDCLERQPVFAVAAASDSCSPGSA